MKMSKLSLPEIQSKFSKILKSPQLDLKTDAQLFNHSKNQPASLETRLGIYHYAYFARIKESLAADFPKLKLELGDEEFSSLIKNYLKKHPSQYPGLAQVGKNLPKFLSKTKKYSKQTHLIELAQTEWAHCLCKWSESSRPMNFSKLLEMPEEEQLRQSLILAPSAQFTKGHVFFKVEHQIKTQELTPSMEELLGEIRLGRNLGELARFLENNSELATGATSQDAAALQAASAMNWISNWVSIGLIIDFSSA